MNTTIAVALITGLFTTIPGLINTIVSNKYQLKLKRFEIDEVAKRQAIINFSESVEDCISYDGGVVIRNIINYQKALDKLLLYFPDIDSSILKKIEKAIHETDMRTKQQAIQPLIRQLSKELFGKSKTRLFGILHE